jgi:hypothetical protein
MDTLPENGVELPDSELIKKNIHVYPSFEDDDSKAKKANELLAAISAEGELYDRFAWYVEDGNALRRFLTARDDDVPKAKSLLLSALSWRDKRKPHIIDYEDTSAALASCMWQTGWTNGAGLS